MTFRLPFEDGHRIAQLASDNDRTVSAELRRAVKLYLRAAAVAEAKRGT